VLSTTQWPIAGRKSDRSTTKRVIPESGNDGGVCSKGSKEERNDNDNSSRARVRAIEIESAGGVNGVLGDSSQKQYGTGVWHLKCPV